MLADINVGVIGTGFMGVTHTEALRRLGVNVIGIVGSSPERARAKAAAANLPRVYDSVDALLADTAVHAVHVTSPNDVHADQVRAALAAGKHVVCEKPLARLRRRRPRTSSPWPRRAGAFTRSASTSGTTRTTRMPRRWCGRARSANRGLSPAATTRIGCCSIPTGTGASSPAGRATCAPCPTSVRTGSI